MKMFKRKLDQNEKLLKNIKEYEQKKKAEQQKSKVLGHNSNNRETNKKEDINV